MRRKILIKTYKVTAFITLQLFFVVMALVSVSQTRVIMPSHKIISLKTAPNNKFRSKV